MNPQLSLKISLVASILGIFLLLAISSSLKPKSIDTNSTLNLNDYVKISGKIIAERSSGDFSVLTLRDEKGNIQITCNCKNLTNKSIEATGKVQEYDNKLQIQADKIILSSKS